MSSKFQTLLEIVQQGTGNEEQESEQLQAIHKSDDVGDGAGHEWTDCKCRAKGNVPNGKNRPEIVAKVAVFEEKTKQRKLRIIDQTHSEANDLKPIEILSFYLYISLETKNI